MSRKINIIVVVLNDKVGLLRTLNSIFDQQIDPELYSVVVVDGDSDDGSHEVASGFLRTSDRLIRREARGIYDAMNQGLIEIISHPKDEGVLFLNSGDFFASQSSLTLLSSWLTENEIVVGLSAYLDPGYSFMVSIPEVRINASDNSYNPVSLWIPHQSFCATLNVYCQIGFMDAGLRIAGDTDWFVRCIKRFGNLVTHPKIISVQIVGGRSKKFAYTGYLERRQIAYRYNFIPTSYPLNLLLRIYVAEKTGIRLPRFLKWRSIPALVPHANIVKRYLLLSSNSYKPSN